MASLLLEYFFFGLVMVMVLLFDCWEELECVRVRGPVGDPKSVAEVVICAWYEAYKVNIEV